MRIVRLAKRYALLGVALVLAGGAGLLTAVALGTSSAEPTRTVTIDVATGPQGPAGPARPQRPPGPVGPPGAGPPGTLNCPVGYSEAVVVFNTPKGHQTLWSCLLNG